MKYVEVRSWDEHTKYRRYYAALKLESCIENLKVVFFTRFGMQSALNKSEVFSQPTAVNSDTPEHVTIDLSLFRALLLLVVICILYPLRRSSFNLQKRLRFVWHACIALNGGREHHERIDKFYKGQADIYDDTRKNLLRGRRTMLRLSAAHLLDSRKSSAKRPFIWIDIGGGTGFNIEVMNEFISIDSFDAVYLVDICEPLLEIARKRIAAHGWKNVHVLHQDAASFVVPEEEASASLITFSYSLSMIPIFYTVLDRVACLLSPENGLLSVVDFYTSGSSHQPSPTDVDRACNWLSRWFWQIWFDFDDVILGPQRREYLEHKFETFKVYNGRNEVLRPLPIHIPYYIWLGCSRHVVPLDIKQRGPSESLFCNAPCRVPYKPSPIHEEINTFLYSFTWEDPFKDMQYLEASASDSLLVITSAGDNALHYALKANLQTIHCVDMNPCQGHLLELKIAALKALPFESFYKMFGLGYIESFDQILDLQLSPLLSAPCYQFWKANSRMFAPSSSLYMYGYSGFALRLVRALFRLAGRRKDVLRMCSTTSIEEQNKIWHERVRPVILNSLTLRLLNNPVFCWRALGVPRNQRNMLLTEGTAFEYIRDTLDPVATSELFSDGAYHYLLTLLGSYTPTSCPSYLTREGFDTLKANDCETVHPIKIHTETISGCLESMTPSSLTRAILMDHLDWFAEESKEVTEEIDLLYKVLKPGGFILLRSAARVPWYIKRFSSVGFETRCLNVRRPGSKVALDRVNM
ncbi:S-adenosyl-L-methionine-dependent methyltransferase [Fomitiporia mediterranea MF3/22]|uniref:S-adenosyl-L-methionine-dependent methyltransferase n=1 Tax=Fomitiporia mediterranea (strain MF3/22) TaxID=694068 RepID=UPI00044076CA|nr:S-adenosyl-L-methionine-dependent methyltransferase [Fomitiporia mediterranea MF3/22]EJD03174.1 S-adenosyl-L-methionine-dependent methyltransferase [Fomitiporia mediterranea MF3/22]